MTLNSLNILLALTAAIACFRAGYFMNGTTPNSLKASFTVVFVALVGYAIGDALGQWKAYLDTLLFGGLAALFLADIRRPAKWVPWAQRASWAAMGATLAALMLAG